MGLQYACAGCGRRPGRPDGSSGADSLHGGREDAAGLDDVEAIGSWRRPGARYVPPMPSVADIVVHRLVETGVRTLFGMPGGGSNLDLVEAAGRAGLPFVLSHTETAGALMASAQAELTSSPG